MESWKREKRYKLSDWKNIKHSWAKRTISSHKRRGFIIEITSNQLFNIIKDLEFCELCGCELAWGHRGHSMDGPSLDRINNEDFIDKNNIMIICCRCNATKLDRTYAEFLEYCKMIVRTHAN